MRISYSILYEAMIVHRSECHDLRSIIFMLMWGGVRRYVADNGAMYSPRGHISCDHEGTQYVDYNPGIRAMKSRVCSDYWITSWVRPLPPLCKGVALRPVCVPVRIEVHEHEPAGWAGIKGHGR